MTIPLASAAPSSLGLDSRAERGPVVAHDAVRSGKRLPLRIPHPAIADPGVNEHDRRPFAGDLPIKLSLLRRGHAAASSPRLARMPSSSSANESANF